jgi:D-glycero-alpha-D-manno-heptose-7-phosphate kinase
MEGKDSIEKFSRYWCVGYKEMIVTKAPLRISLAGGGSDLPSFYKKYAGQVFSFAINKYVYIACHELFSGGIRLSYSRTENVKLVSDIEHPLIRESLTHLNFQKSIEIGSFADVPGTGTGLGSSSAFTVALLAAISEFSNNTLDSKSLAKSASLIEIEKCKEPIGKQDQYASAYGGINQFIFHKNDSVTVMDYYSTSTSKFLEQSIMLFYLGTGRNSSAILTHQNNAMLRSSSEFESVKRIRDRVPKLIDSVLKQDVGAMAAVIRESWDDKKNLHAHVSNSSIESAISSALSSGAIAAKVVGAGGGGFLMVVVDPARRLEFIDKFKILRNLPFKISKNGAEVVYSDER